jgi:hypothetical protein
MLSGRTTTTVSAPANSPIDLNATRPTFGELAPLFGLTFLAIVPIAIGMSLLNWSFPREGQEIGGWQLMGLLLGGLLMLGGGRFFWALGMTIPHSVQRHYARVDEWHYAVIEKFESGDGQITAVQVSEWEYSPVDPRKVAFALLAVYLSNPRSLSIDTLMKHGLWVRVGQRSFPLIKFTQDGAAAFLNLLAASGGITGRGPRTAGEITFGSDFRAVALKALRLTLDDPRAMAAVEVQE